VLSYAAACTLLQFEDEAIVQAREPRAVQPHLRKCFEAISRLHFADDLQISAMQSAEGEVMPFDKPMYPEVRC